jgi:large subunit ribosomal protein L21
MYAIVKTGGKQYRVEAGRSIEVERLPGQEGDSVELGEVLLIAENGDVTVGTPMIEGARVLAHVEQQGRAKKIIVFKYKSKVRTRKKTGHRQSFTRLAVQEILRPGEEAKVSRTTPVDGNLDTEVEAAEAIVTIGEEAAAPKRRIRRAAPKPEKTPAKAATPKRPVRATAKAEKPAAKPKAAKPVGVKATKPAAKAKAPVKSKAVAKPEKKLARRLPLRRKKETE